MIKLFRTILVLFLCIGLLTAPVQADTRPAPASSGVSGWNVLGWGGFGGGILAAILWGVNNHQLNMLKRRRHILRTLQAGIKGSDPTSQSHKTLANHDMNRLNRQILRAQKRDIIIASVASGLGAFGLTGLVGGFLTDTKTGSSSSPGADIIEKPKPVPHPGHGLGKVLSDDSVVPSGGIKHIFDELEGLGRSSSNERDFDLGWRRTKKIGSYSIPFKDGQLVDRLADGGCFFHTIVSQMDPVRALGLGIPSKSSGQAVVPADQDLGQTFRRQVVDYVRHIAEGTPSDATLNGVAGNVMNQIVADYGSLEKYRQEMSKYNEWAQFPEVIAAVTLTRRPLIVWHPKDVNGKRYMYINGIIGSRFAKDEYADPKTWMHAHYSGAHYDVFLPSDASVDIPQPAPTVPALTEGDPVGSATNKPKPKAKKPKPKPKPAPPRAPGKPKPSPAQITTSTTTVVSSPATANPNPTAEKPKTKPKQAPAPPCGPATLTTGATGLGAPKSQPSPAATATSATTRGTMRQKAKKPGLGDGLLGSGRLNRDSRPIDRHFLDRDKFPQVSQKEWASQPEIKIMPRDAALELLRSGEVPRGLHFVIENDQFGKVAADGSCGWYACEYRPGSKLNAPLYRCQIRKGVGDSSLEMNCDSDIENIHNVPGRERNIFILEPVGWDEHGNMVVKLDKSLFNPAYTTYDPIYLLHMKQDVGKDRDFRVGVHYDLFRPEGGFADQEHDIGSKGYDDLIRRARKTYGRARRQTKKAA